MKIVNVRIDELVPYEKNTKKHDLSQVKNVAASIEHYGFVQPLVIDKDNVVVIGHCRLMAAAKLKMKEVPCVRVENLTEEQIKALRIVDNKSNESPWDMEFLMEELPEIDLSSFDFDFDIDIDEDEDEETEESSKDDERTEVKLKESISVVIDCIDDEEAQVIFERLSEEGYMCRISTL